MADSMSQSKRLLLSPQISGIRLSSSSFSEYDYLFKVLIIGDSGTGKSSLLIRFCDDYYSDKFISTIGVDFKIKTLELDDKLVKLQVWDSAGQERFRTLTTTYYRGAHAIIIVYDICDRASFVNIGAWLAEINKNATDNVYIIVVGNKCDKEEREVDYESAKAFANRLGFPFIESSAKKDINIQKIFRDLVTELKKRLVTSDTTKHNTSSSLGSSHPSFSGGGSEVFEQKSRFSLCCGTTWS